MQRILRRRAFTLLELLVVLGILALLITLVAPRVVGKLGESRPVVTRTQIQNTVVALEQFRLDIGRYPTTAEGLQALVERPQGLEKWNGPYLTRRSLPPDGWGRPLQYRSPAQGVEYPFEVFSLGANNQEGGEGEDADIYSWD
ncbi:MAG: type II secretion system protein GspG [Phycisphaerales bacterium]|nr:MAG: type II secretion system protein GspG [Phycisphaerales bacterium]